MAKQKTRQTAQQTNAKPKQRGKPRKRARGAPTTSDKADARWTIRGVPTNVREIAVKGAKERGMTVGDWLSEIIVLSRHAHTADGKGTAIAMPQAELIDLVQRMNNRLTAIEKQRSQGFWKSFLGGRNGRQAA